MSYFPAIAMNRLDRTLGMLLLLRGGRIVSAAELSARFEVSIRTVYRDLEALSALGVPIEAEMGRTGGYRLREGYFLPPVTLAPEEAVSLLIGLLLMRRLRVAPFPAEADFAERKLLAALPEETRRLVERASSLIGFEPVPADLLHPEREDPLSRPRGMEDDAEALVVGRFLKAALSRSRVSLRYRSPYRASDEPPREVEPRGVLWDRDRWYLVGDVEVRPGEPRMWRADRVEEIHPGPSMRPTRGDLDLGGLLGRKWLEKAMERWRETGAVRIALSAEQAALLRRDWYYGHARFEERLDGRVEMSYGESMPEAAAALVRWLGPGAELLEPAAWRPIVAAGLREMLAAHES
jgi:predicted DNA-binding transcriptional regulator YafY